MILSACHFTHRKQTTNLLRLLAEQVLHLGMMISRTTNLAGWSCCRRIEGDKQAMARVEAALLAG
jgi:hypothetical protein